MGLTIGMTVFAVLWLAGNVALVVLGVRARRQSRRARDAFDRQGRLL